MVVRKIRRYIEGIEIRRPSQPLLIAGLLGILLFGFMSLAQAQTPLQNVAPGTVITFSGKDWIILEHMPNGETYIVLEDFLFQRRAFDEDGTNRFNPSDPNNIAYYLNNDFYNGLSQKALINEHSWNIGQYGNVSCKIGLLSLNEYISYSIVYNGSVLPWSPSEGYWWLITPYSQSSLSEDFVYMVDNGLGYWANANADSPNGYVRPTLYLKSGLVLGPNNTVEEGTTPPAVPTGLSAVATSPTTVLLTWNANTEPDLAGYKIYRNGVKIETVGKVTSWTDSTVSPGTTYTYELVAYNTAGQESQRSNPATVTTPSASRMLHDQEPGTIINFSGREWIILEHMPNGETYLILKYPDCQMAFDANNTNLFDPSDSNNVAYYLNTTFYNSLSQKDFISDHAWDRVSVHGNWNDSTDYGPVTAKVGLISFREYERYSIVYEGTILPDNYEYLWWTRTTRAEHSNHVWYVHTDGQLSASGGYANDGSFSVRPTIYLKAGLALDEDNNVIEGPGGTPPAAPIGLSAVATSPTTVVLSWNANTEPDLAGYKIYRDGVHIETVGKVTSWTDTTVLPSTTYTYQITAYNTSGQESQRSNPATVTTPDLPTPTGLTAMWKGDYIEVTWEAGDIQLGSQAALWRQMENGPWQAIKILKPAEKVSFVLNDRNVGVGVNCRYEIRECRIEDFFEWTVVAESGWATGDQPLTAPGGLRVASLGEDTAVITWNAVVGTSTYIVQYSVGGQSWQTQTVASTSANVPRGSKVRVKADGTYSHWSGVVTVR